MLHRPDGVERITSDRAIFLSLNQPPKHYSTLVLLCKQDFAPSGSKLCPMEVFLSRRHGLPSLMSHWLCRNPGPSAVRPSQFNFLSCGCWHHNPQIYSTKAAGEILIPNPRESIHFSPASPCRAHHRDARADKDGTHSANTSWDGVTGWAF